MSIVRAPLSVAASCALALISALACDSAESTSEDAGGTAATTGGTASKGGTAGSSGTGGSSKGGAAGSGGSSVLSPDGCVPGRLATIGELRGQFDTLQPTIDGKEYFLQVNEWNSDAPQTMAYGGDFVFKMTQQDAVVPTNGGPSGFPSIFIGANAGNSTAGSNLPKQVSALTSVPSTWIWSDNGLMADPVTNIFNATYDVWFSTNAAGEPDAFGPTGGYLMVWLYDPPSAQPIGGRAMAEGVTIDGVDGTWDIWIGPNGGHPCISYVRTEPSLSLSTDLNYFIRDAVENRANTIQDAWYLTNVFTGFEIWSGGAGLETTSFCTIVD